MLKRKEIPRRGKTLAQKWIPPFCQNFISKFNDKRKNLQHKYFHKFTVLFNNDIKISIILTYILKISICNFCGVCLCYSLLNASYKFACFPVIQYF